MRTKEETVGGEAGNRLLKNGQWIKDGDWRSKAEEGGC